MSAIMRLLWKWMWASVSTVCTAHVYLYLHAYALDDCNARPSVDGSPVDIVIVYEFHFCWQKKIKSLLRREKLNTPIVSSRDGSSGLSQVHTLLRSCRPHLQCLFSEFSEQNIFFFTVDYVSLSEWKTQCVLSCDVFIVYRLMLLLCT